MIMNKTNDQEDEGFWSGWIIQRFWEIDEEEDEDKEGIFFLMMINKEFSSVLRRRKKEVIQ